MNRLARPFTGQRMLLVMLAFFGVVIAVNVTMAVLATRTFGGKIVDNSYVATQRFNGWLEQARSQEKLGWSETVRLGADRHVELELKVQGGSLTGAAISADARHPLGGEEDIALVLGEVAPGQYRSNAPLPAGRWQVHIAIAAQGAEKRLIETMQ